jgi:hypothetical protein
MTEHHYAQPKLEISNQILGPYDAWLETDGLPRLPLYDLQSAAPDISNFSYNANNIIYPIANDACTAGHFERMKSRTQTLEYQVAENRVAVVVGESALAANIVHIPEETIIVIDTPDMCAYMEHYVDGLRNAPDPDAWIQELKPYAPDDLTHDIQGQVIHWTFNKRPTPFADQAAFIAAQRAAHQKAIIAWSLDITNAQHMQSLGDALRARNASVTMVNATNVLQYVEDFIDPAACADALAPLPFTPNAPILTSSLRLKPLASTADVLIAIQGISRNYNNGPFFGLENLKRAADDQPLHPLGTIEVPHFTQASHYSHEPIVFPGNSMVTSILLKDMDPIAKDSTVGLFLDGHSLQVQVHSTEAVESLQTSERKQSVGERIANLLSRFRHR